MTKMIDITTAVALMAGYTVEQLRGRKRTKRLALCRHIAIFMCRQATDNSYPAIGRYFGLDHSSCVYAENRIQAMLYESVTVRREGVLDRIEEDVTALAQSLSGQRSVKPLDTPTEEVIFSPGV